MYIVDVLKKGNYFALAVVAAVFMFFFYPFVQTLGLQTDLWYQIIPPLNFGLFLIFSALFGVFVSFQVHNLRGPKACKMNKKGTSGGIAGTGFGFFVGVCPACAGFAGLFLPLAVVTTLVVFGAAFILISIALLLLSIYLNGGFKKAP